MNAYDSLRARRGFNWTSLGVLAACAAFGTSAMSAPARGDWPTVGRDQGGQRHSPLTQISPANVGKLQQAWVYRMKTGETAAAIEPLAATSRW
jgi:quinoprotein glucose dehydrogenase